MTDTFELNNTGLGMDDYKVNSHRKVRTEKIKDSLKLIDNNKKYYSSEYTKQENISNNIKLVVYIVNNKFSSFSKEFEDMISVGTIGLIKAVNTFDESKNVKFATYASRCIKNEINMYLRSIKKYNKQVSINETLAIDADGNELTFEDICGTNDDILSKNIEKECEIKEALVFFEKLPKLQKDILANRLGLFGVEEKRQKQVAADMGYSQSYISRMERNALRKLRIDISSAHKRNSQIIMEEKNNPSK